MLAHFALVFSIILQVFQIPNAPQNLPQNIPSIQSNISSFNLSQVNSIVPVAISFLGIVSLVAIFFAITKSLLQAIFGLIANAVAGFVAFYVLNYFGIHLALTTGTIIAIAIFGLPAVGTLVVLHYIP